MTSVNFIYNFRLQNFIFVMAKTPRGRNLIKLNSNSPNDIDKAIDPRYECAICLYWLNEPVLTSCGHRFCKKCILSWLTTQSQCCPLDSKPLTIKDDIFPDNFTRREIALIKNPCPNAERGCKIEVSPFEMDKHLLECQYQEQIVAYECPFKNANCQFIGKSEDEISSHVHNDMTAHLNLLMEKINKKKLLNDVNTEGWDPPSKENSNKSNGASMDENLIKTMYERIVVLEQKSREQECKIEKLEKELSIVSKTKNVQSRYSNGVIVWEITDFSNKVKQMTNNPNILYYSSNAYTSPYGYKFCARVNISPKTKEFLSLHVHLMQSENDFHLDWPFKGRIKISMIHPKEQSLSQHDTMMSNPDVLAFHKPAEEISPRGFGFIEYATISNILRRGFVVNDRLLIKIQMNIV